MNLYILLYVILVEIVMRNVYMTISIVRRLFQIGVVENMDRM